jgi:endoglucanase
MNLRIPFSLATPFFTPFLLAVALAGNAAAQPAAKPSPPPQVKQNCSAVSAETCAVAHALRRGINLGNMLDAPREGDWGVKLEPQYIDRAASNFATVRLPVRWSNHAAPTADAKIDEQFAQRVDWAIDALLAKGVYVILDLHHYTQLAGDPQHNGEFPVDASVVETRYLNLWKQIAQRYKGKSPKLIFELLNEAHGSLTTEKWNGLSAKALAIVRETNPTRAVLIGPGEWGGIGELPKLRLPADRNIIVAIHNYDPFPFTHQGADFLAKPFPTGVKCCDDGQKKVIADVLEKARAWNRTSGYPLHLGEFGTYEAVDMESRGNYARLVRDEAEKRGIGWTYWELASPSFGMYSPKTGQWHEPIRRALLD